MGHPWEAEAPLFSQSGTSCHLPSSWFLLLLDSTPFAHPSGHQPPVHTQSHPELPLHAPCFLPVPCPGSRHPPGTIFPLDHSWGHSPRAMVDSTPTPGKLAPGEARYQLESLLVFMFQAYQLPGGAQKSTCLARCSQPGMRAVNFSLGSWNPSSLPALRVPLRARWGRSVTPRVLSLGPRLTPRLLPARQEGQGSLSTSFLASFQSTWPSTPTYTLPVLQAQNTNTHPFPVLGPPRTQKIETADSKEKTELWKHRAKG